MSDTDSKIVQTINQFKANLLAREAAQMAAMGQTWQGLEKRLQADIELLARQVAELKANGQPVTIGRILRLERYKQLQAQIAAEFGQYGDYAANTIANGQLDFANLGAQGATAALGELGIKANRLPVEAIQNLVGAVGDGSPLRSYLLDNATQTEAVNRLINALLDGVAKGINPTKTARAMQDGLSGGLTQAIRTARTEQLRAYRLANLQQYAQSGLVDGYYRLATRDGRTCPACLAKDGQFYELGQEFDEHVQGRCTVVPSIKGQPAPQWLKGADWFAQQNESTQRDILGGAKFEAWQAGDFVFEDLATTTPNATWGPSLQVTPLKDLAGG